MIIETLFSIGDSVKVTLDNSPFIGEIVGVHVEVKDSREWNLPPKPIVSYDVMLPPKMRGRPGTRGYVEQWRYAQEWVAPAPSLPKGKQ